MYYNTGGSKRQKCNARHFVIIKDITELKQKHAICLGMALKLLAYYVLRYIHSVIVTVNTFLGVQLNIKASL